MSTLVMVWVLLLTPFLNIDAILAGTNVDAINYKDALQKSILFFEGQRSGSLPSNQRVKWRGDSGLSDGKLGNVDLKGGYYDAGDNVKFGWPMSFTVTLLSWAAIQYRFELSQAKQLNHLLEAIRWGTDFLMKSYTSSTTLWTQVGDGNMDHQCWERPEDMDTPRTLYQINSSSPGTEVAADAAAALSSAAIAWKDYDSSYSRKLVINSRSLFKFANEHRASYQASCPFYCSYSGFNDELLWAASWLYKATRARPYLKFLLDNQEWSSVISEFSWDNKFVGTQILLTQEYLLGEKSLQKYKIDADSFICALMPGSSTVQIQRTPGGLLYTRDGSNLQYVTSASNAMIIYSDIIDSAKISSISCGAVSFKASEIRAFAKSQVDYILGHNPLRMSYMVGFGSKYPHRIHHRGASIPSIFVKREKVGCNQGYSDWYNRNSSNPNVHIGAIVGGPNSNDKFKDDRSDYGHLEPTTYMNAPLVGSLARLLQKATYPNVVASYLYLSTNKTTHAYSKATTWDI